MSLHLGFFCYVAKNRKLIALTFLLSGFTFFVSGILPFTTNQSLVFADSLPCQNAVETTNLTDNYLTKDGKPYWEFQVNGRGAPGTSVNVSQSNLTLKVDFSQLQALFGSSNSNYLESNFQDPNHAQTNVTALNSQEKNAIYGPGQKDAPISMLDQLRVKYVAYILAHPELPEYATNYSDVNGQNPATISQMTTSLGFPNPPVPPSQGGDKSTWLNNWGKYWEKIPTAYNEYFQGKLQLAAAVGTDQISKVAAGQFCPGKQPGARVVTFVMPDFFRTAAVSGQVNQLIVPKEAQSPNNNIILASAQEIKNTIAGLVNYCVHLATQNPVSNQLKKIISQSIQKNLPSDVFADSCVLVRPDSKKGDAPYCALPAGQLQSGETCSDIPNDPNKLDTANTNVVCNFSFNWSASLAIPAFGDHTGWDSCTNNGDGTQSCTATVDVWPDFRIPWLANISSNTSYSQDNQPGDYTFFTPNAVKKLIYPSKHDLALKMIVECYPNYPSDTRANCTDLDSIGGIIPCKADLPIDELADCVAGKIVNAQPGQINNGTASDIKQKFIGSVDCSKIFTRDMALKPIEVQKLEGVDTSCVPAPTTISLPTPPKPPVCSPTSQNGVLGSGVGFSATAGDGTFSWSAPGGTPQTGSGSTFSTTYSAAGTFTVTVTSATQTSTCSVTITVPPVSCSPSTQAITIGSSASFTASGGNSTFSWSAPGGSPSNGSGSSFTTTYSLGGTQTVTVTSLGSSANCTVTVNIPNVSCSPSTQTITTGTSVSFSATGGNGTFSWSGGGSPSTGSGASFTTTYSTAGTYTVTASSAGKTGTCSVTVNAPAPSCTISPSSGNIGTSITVTAKNLPGPNLPLSMIGAFGTPIDALGTISTGAQAFTIPSTTLGIYRVRIDLGGGNFLYCTPDLTVNGFTSLNFSWPRPAGFVAFSDSGGVTSSCTSTSLSCTSAAIYWPFSSIIFNVRPISFSNPISFTGGTTANGAIPATATANWTWKYTAVIWPNTFSNCLTAGGQCKVNTLNGNTDSNPQTTFTGLDPNTTYSIEVCTPDCGTGTSIYNNSSKPNKP